MGANRVALLSAVCAGLTLNGAGIEARGQAVIQGPDGRFSTRGDLTVLADDFSRFAALSGLDLTGAGRIDLGGTAQPFDGVFDLQLRAIAEDLAFGLDQVDPLLAGRAIVMVEAQRDTEGTRLPVFSLRSDPSTAARIAAAEADRRLK